MLVTTSVEELKIWKLDQIERPEQSQQSEAEPIVDEDFQEISCDLAREETHDENNSTQYPIVTTYSTNFEHDYL
jgi:hypothetical protein